MSLDLDQGNNIPLFSDEENNCLAGHSNLEILLGKEKAIFNHAGNKRFRAIINHNVHKYMNAPIKSKKSRVVRKIHAEMKIAGFRFLKKSQFKWNDLREADAREKVSHALRDKVREIRRPTKFERVSSEGIYPLITSMAKMIKRNQMLLNKATESLEPHVPENPAYAIHSKKIGSAYPTIQDGIGHFPIKKALPGGSSLDLIDSMPPHDQQQGFQLGSKSRNEVKSTEIASGYEGKDICTQSHNFSTEESLFGGLADEIAGVPFETTSISDSVQDQRQKNEDVPIQYITFSSEFGASEHYLHDEEYLKLNTI